MWRGSFSDYVGRPPSVPGAWYGYDQEDYHFPVRRHGKHLNILFFDGSVRHLRVRDL